MDKLEHIFALRKNQPYLLCLYRAVFTTAYYGLFRRGELTASPHSILAQNVHIGVNKNKLLVLLESSKTHCKGDPLKFIKINSTPMNKFANNHSNKYCPFIILKSYIKARPQSRHTNEEFFVFSDNSPLKADTLRSVLWKTLSNIGLQANLYNIHSYRIRRCADLLKLGLSVEMIKKIGRWKSNAVFSYLRNL